MAEVEFTITSSGTLTVVLITNDLLRVSQFFGLLLAVTYALSLSLDRSEMHGMAAVPPTTTNYGEAQKHNRTLASWFGNWFGSKQTSTCSAQATAAAAVAATRNLLEDA